MNRDNIKKVLILCVDSICDDCPYADTKDCYNQIKLDARELIIEQENEIEKLKAENVRLTTKLGQVLLSIDTVKEMNTMCNIDEQVKQAKIDVLAELKCRYGLYYLSAFGVKERMLADILNPMIEELKK